MVIYKITNIINGKEYIGQTTKTIEQRWKRHCWGCTLKSGRMVISTAIAKYGKENFIIEKVQEASSQEELDNLEIYYAKKYNTFSPNGYNLKAGNGNGCVSEETRRKISIANKGRVASEETREKLRISHLGQKPTEEQIKNLKKMYKNKCVSLLGPTASVLVKQKTYHFISPKNEPTTITNMNKFCRENKISASKMCLVAQGKRNHHKGWKLNTILIDEKVKIPKFIFDCI